MPSLERLFSRHLEDDEPLYMLVHRHWILSLKELSFPVIAFVLSWGFWYFFPIFPILLAVCVFNIAILVWGTRNFLDYYLDALLVTDRAVIDVEWHGWFHRESTRVDYASIEGVSYEIKGVAGTLLNYGTITIERIGSGSEVQIKNVKRPKDIESAILACQTECIRAKNLKDSSAVKDIIAEIVAERMHIKDFDQNEAEQVEA